VGASQVGCVEQPGLQRVEGSEGLRALPCATDVQEVAGPLLFGGGQTRQPQERSDAAQRCVGIQVVS
jgi:hypothetical protein